MQTNLSETLEKLVAQREKDHRAQLEIDIEAARREAEKRVRDKYDKECKAKSAEHIEKDKVLKSLLDGIMERRAQPPIKWNE